MKFQAPNTKLKPLKKWLTEASPELRLARSDAARSTAPLAPHLNTASECGAIHTPLMRCFLRHFFK
jgi:hypothetical protein